MVEREPQVAVVGDRGCRGPRARTSPRSRSVAATERDRRAALVRRERLAGIRGRGVREAACRHVSSSATAATARSRTAPSRLARRVGRRRAGSAGGRRRRRDGSGRGVRRWRWRAGRRPRWPATPSRRDRQEAVDGGGVLGQGAVGRRLPALGRASTPFTGRRRPRRRHPVDRGPTVVAVGPGRGAGRVAEGDVDLPALEPQLLAVAPPPGSASTAVARPALARHLERSLRRGEGGLGAPHGGAAAGGRLGGPGARRGRRAPTSAMSGIARRRTSLDLIEVARRMAPQRASTGRAGTGRCRRLGRRRRGGSRTPGLPFIDQYTRRSPRGSVGVHQSHTVSAATCGRHPTERRQPVGRS